MIVAFIIAAFVVGLVLIFVYASWETRDDRRRLQRLNARGAGECSYCAAEPRTWYRVVDADGEEVWDGGCYECADMISSRIPGSMIDVRRGLPSRPSLS